MDPQPYRLWLRWQQMHYPRRGLPASQSAVEELLAVDGISAGLLEPCLRPTRPTRSTLRPSVEVGARGGSAYDGDAAMERLAVNDYDIVVFDRDMPIVSGDEVCLFEA